MKAETPLVDTRVGWITELGPVHIYNEVETLLAEGRGNEWWEHGSTLCGRLTRGQPTVWALTDKPYLTPENSPKAFCKTCTLRYLRGHGLTTLARHEFQVAE